MADSEARPGTAGLNGVLKLLKGAEDRRARFGSVVALSFHGETHLFRGEAHGTIARAPKGSGGFGYDPIFVPEGSAVTFGAMPLEKKPAPPHRGPALAQLSEFLSREGRRRAGGGVGR